MHGVRTRGRQAAARQRRLTYACAGALLSTGAPTGLLALQVLRRRGGPARSSSAPTIRQIVTTDWPGYVYVAASTALAFGLFGYVLGRQADRLAALSETDALTGLSNARALFKQLDVELARSRRYREPLALLLVDLDDLKSINDRYGHRAGDEALRSLAAVIRSQLRETDVGARWGGDEFAIVAPRTSKVAALALAERIRHLIPDQSAPLALAASLGVASVDPESDSEFVDAPTLMRAADAAMYTAKRGGKNSVATASPTGPLRHHAF
jgi:diguanylate cyclase (GGDEF)-like protein